ncbi:putative abc a-pheromone efflux pump [Phaeomoniella chlamydospora]|uniref:Putative abc a-pheromone efflux pump n=1 Tax=Phaeomoniella chlamydospora TaxID=158046 RepID=A0A0G2DXS4_PHACM|nr:putative abc a-pheromone efflux pump [Phaeomoniella chlamydospora]
MATSQPLGFVAQNIISSLASLGVAFYYSWKLTMVTMSTVPIAFIVLGLLSTLIHPSMRDQDAQLNYAAKCAHSALISIGVVKGFNAQEHEAQHYSMYVKQAAAYYRKQAHSNAVQMGFVRVFTLAMFVQGYWYGHHLVAEHALSFADVTTTFWACLLATKAFEEILPQMLVLERGRAAGMSLKTLLEQVTKEPVREPSQRGKTPKFCDGDIEFRNVSFAYPSRPEHLVLATSRFFFPAGETTFLAGKSGSGKSTVGNLIMRFYEPTSGQIFIDATDIAELDTNWLRNNVTLVQQQSQLFKETILRNIAFGRHEYHSVTLEEMKICLELANLQDTVTHLPQGADTLVGTSGAALSGGQRQRVAIARARLRDTPILILDESTSALDNITRTSIMASIRKWRKGRTTIIITHDMSQIKRGEFVYVLEEGCLIQEGFHQHLARHGSDPFTNFSKFDEESTPAQDTTTMDQPLWYGTPVARPAPLGTELSHERWVQTNRLSIFERPAISSISNHLAVPPYNPLASGLSVRNSLVLHTTYDSEAKGSYDTPKLPPVSRLSRLMGPIELDTVKSKGINPRQPSYVVERSSRGKGTPLEHMQRTRRSSFMGKSNKQKNESRNNISILPILMTIWPSLTNQYRLILILAFIAALTNAAGPPVFSYIFSQLLTTFFHPRQDAHKALQYSLYILAVAGIDGLGCYLMHYLLECSGQAWVDTLRIEAMKRILDQPKEWFEDEKNLLSSLTMCLDRNANEMRNLLGRFAGLLFIAATMVLVAIVWSMIVCWKLTLVALAAIPGMYAITKIFDSVTARWERKTSEAADVCGSILVETFSDIKTVRSLTLEGYFHQKYKRAVRRTLSLNTKKALYCGIFFGAAESAIHFITALVFWYGVRVVASDDFTIKSVLIAFSMILFSAANANALLLFIPQISSSVQTAEKLFKLANLPLGVSHEYSGNIRLPTNCNVDISFNNLSFSYPIRPESHALRDLTLDIPPNGCTAIVGQSGSGKSTIASLLLGFYSCTPRSDQTQSSNSVSPITISSFAISSLYTPRLRNIISLVPQNPTLFPISVTQNIIYGLPLSSPYTTSSSIELAARLSGIHDFILTLPHGYETVVSHGDTNTESAGSDTIGLSGGQAQRIAIARALVRKPRVLILDEATSALDSVSAGLIRDSIRSLLDPVQHPNHPQHTNRHDPEAPKPLAVILITHSREMMKLADNIVVMKDGTCVEQGKWRALKDRRGGELNRILRAGVDEDE